MGWWWVGSAMPPTSQGEKKKERKPIGAGGELQSSPRLAKWKSGISSPAGRILRKRRSHGEGEEGIQLSRGPRRLVRSLHTPPRPGAVVSSITKILAMGCLDLPGTDHGVVGKTSDTHIRTQRACRPWNDADAFMSMETRTKILLGGAWAVLLFGSGTSRDQTWGDGGSYRNGCSW